MQIESLKMFCDLVETESFTKAAQINAVTQSAVSQTISAIERNFKSLLVERSRKQFRLTREGQVFYDNAKQIVEAFEAAQNRLQEIKNVLAGSIAVSTVYSIGLYELPLRLKTYLKARPTVNVHVAYRRADQVYEDVLMNVADLGLVAYPHKDPKLIVTSIGKDRLVVICHPQHPLTKSRSIKLSRLADQTFIAFEPDIPTRRAVDRILRDQSVKVRNVMELDNIDTLKRAVEIDAGISIVPQNTVMGEVKKGTLAQLEIEDRQYWRPLGAIYKANKVLTPAMKEFLSILKGP
jgi:DNA-binding transcriptional LysR family regulator